MASNSDLYSIVNIRTEIDTYQIDLNNKLGAGRFANVYSAYSKRRKGSVAVKVVKKKEMSETSLKNLKDEVDILQSLDHLNIVKFFDCHDDGDSKTFYLFTRKMQTDLLKQILKSPKKHLDERTTRFVATQVLEAVRYLHSRNIAHCDLKPGNVLLQYDLKREPLPFIQICDFGYARYMTKDSRRDSNKGSQPYSPPELLLKLEHNRCIDIWSVGVMIYVCLTGAFPFSGSDAEAIAADIDRKLELPDELYLVKDFADVSVECVEMLKLILSRDYSKLSVRQVLRSQWFYDEQLKEDLESLEKRTNTRIYTATLHLNKKKYSQVQPNNLK